MNHKLKYIVPIFFTTLILITGVAGFPTGSDSDESLEFEVNSDLRETDQKYEQALVLLDSEERRSDNLLERHTKSKDEIKKFARNNEHIKIKNTFWITNAVLVEINTHRFDFKDLNSVSNIESVQPNFNFNIKNNFSPEKVDINSNVQTTYGLDIINASEVWNEYNSRGNNVNVSVIDTGVNASHQDIDLNKWADFNNSGNKKNTQPYDINGHGTHVSGTVAGGDASGKHIGVAPDANLYHAKVMDNNTITGAALLSALEWSYNESADVISMSLGASGAKYEFMIDPIRSLQNNSITVVSAIGNDGVGTSGSPGNIYDGISVGAIGENLDVESFSSGTEISKSAWNNPPDYWPTSYIVPSVSAPGDSVVSSITNGGYGISDGTSMATPHVSGGIAVIESVVGDVDPYVMEDKLENNAFKPDNANTSPGTRDNRYGSGIVDIYSTIKSFDLGLNVTDVKVRNSTVGNDAIVNVSLYNPNSANITTKLSISSQIYDSETNVTVNEKSQKHKLFRIETKAGDSGFYDMLVEIGDRDYNESLRIFEYNLSSTITDIEGKSVSGDLNITVNVKNQGTNKTLHNISASIGELETKHKTVNVSDGENTTVRFNLSSDVAGYKNVTISSNGIQLDQREVNIKLPPIKDKYQRPKDLDQDGYFEDITGDGRLSIIDVVVFFESYGTNPVISTYPQEFMYGGYENQRITILDVVVLFEQV